MQNKQEIDISVIIVNYKSWNHLNNCLKSLQKVANEIKNLEVIVVDNYSNDNKFKVFKNNFKNINFFLNTGNNGFSNGCNYGAKKANGSYLLFLNPDTIVTTEPIEKMFSYLKSNKNCGAISCKQKNETSYEKIYRFFPKFSTLFGFVRFINKNKLLSKIKRDKNVIFPDWVSGAVVFISKKWFDKINGWNEDYWMYYEDVDLSKKIRNNGGEVALLTNTQITHNHGGSSRINFKTASITKTEVLISKHVYIRNHFSGLHHLILQFLLVFVSILSKLLYGILGIVLFFIPKLRLNIILLFKILRYYIFSIINKSWLSEKSVNF